MTSAELAREFWRTTNPHLPAAQVEKTIAEMLDPRRAAESLEVITANLPFALEGKRLLELGSGVGTVVRVARERGIDAWGIEPDPRACGAARLILIEHNIEETITCAVGESLPYANDSFDVVCSFQVLEHTRDPGLVLAEAVRVLRPGGYFVHVFPNYGSIWEGHYGVLWLPYLPKALGRIYIRLIGRDLAMLEELQLLSHGQVARLMRAHPDVEILSWGENVWEHRLRTLDFSEWGYLGRLKRLVRWAHQLRLVGLIARVGRRFHLETPIILVGVKHRLEERTPRAGQPMGEYRTGPSGLDSTSVG